MNSGKVQFKNNVECDVEDVGDVKIRMYDDITRTLTDVRHILELTKDMSFLSGMYSAACRYIYYNMEF